jgi:hypothetical protein
MECGSEQPDNSVLKDDLLITEKTFSLSASAISETFVGFS